MCARPISSSRALLRVRTCEPTHRKQLAAGVLTILWAIDRYRFLPRQPCLSNLILQEERVTRLLDKGHTVDIVYLDFAKIFDSVNHRFLLAKLKSFGIDGAVLN